MNIQDWFPLGWTGLIPLQSKGLSRVFSNTTVQKHHSSLLSFLYGPPLTSILNYWRNHSFDRQTIVGKVTSLLFNILSKLVIAFLPKSKCLLTSWLQSPSLVILEPKKIKSVTDYYCFVVNLDIRKCESFNFVIFKIIILKIVLFILGPLNFCINFLISLPAKTSLDFDGMACCAWDIASTLKTGLSEQGRQMEA